MFEQPIDFRDECDALQALLDPLAELDFERTTQFQDWSIHDVIAHLHLWNWAADLSLRDGDAFRAFWSDIRSGITDGHSLIDLTDAWLRGARNREVFELWRAFYPELADHFAETDPKARVPWAGPDMSARSSVAARLMETWAHGQEIYDLLGVERIDTDRVRNIAILGVNTFGWTFRNRELEIPEPVPRVRLEAPSGEIWEWNAEVESDLVEGRATEFCQVIAQTRNAADTELRVSGDIAQRWISIAQCFAGPPSDPPAPGTRFTAR